MKNARWLSWTLAASFTGLLGCGSPPPPRETATKDIESAKLAIDSARMAEKAGQLDMALARYRKAKEEILKGKDKAEGSEEAQLASMDDEVRERLVALETKKIAMVAQPERPKPVATAPKSEDPEEKKRRDAEVAEAKRKADAAKANEKLDATFKTGVSVGKPKEKAPDEDDTVAAKKDDKTATKKAGKEGEKEGDADPAADETKKPIKPAKGPYPAITEQSPELDIVKLQVKGKFALAYFQIYNKKDIGRRIMSHAVYFKNANGQEIVNPPSVGVFPYTGFKADSADPSTQQIDGVTSGSHQVTGFDGLQFVAVGQCDNAANIKSVGVIVVFDDGTKLSAAGPAGGVDLNAAGGGIGPPIKGLKTK